jgi:hypothetical protein
LTDSPEHHQSKAPAREIIGVRVSTPKPTITTSTMATLREGSRAAKKSITLNMSTNPRISFSTKRRRVENSLQEVAKNTRMMSGLLAKIINKPPTIRSSEEM